ncbi:MAG: TonB-dependent receptor family protein [Muribaculaceae bacterium]|nr:TonB-dependent receptor family protein [Muribaculaceae bacterium]
MKRITIFLLGLLWVLTAYPQKITYNFKSKSLSEALALIADQHPEININFIYNELDNYKVSANIDTDNVFKALKQLTDLNPVSVIKKGNRYYIEALQHGKFRYYGQVVDTDNEPVVAATVMLLAPKDSTVVTYGITDTDGRFSIPCDRKDVIGKLSHIGYKTLYRTFKNFAVGTVKMSEHSIALKGISVAGDNVHLYADKSVYLPTSRQKNAAIDASDLLRLMAIPQITISPVTGEVSDNFGKKIMVYINNIEASKEDIEGLRTQEVRKVEYLSYPTDPRFQGAERVINFIVQEYVYGGYTKLRTSDSFVAGFSNKTTVFSKFTFNNWIYDLYMAADNVDNHHSGSSTDASYSLIDDHNNLYKLDRNESIEKSHYKQDQFPVTLRASYNSEKVQVRNTVGFSHDNTRNKYQSGSLNYTPSNGMDYSFIHSNPSISNSLSYNGQLYLSLPKDLSINFTPRFSYTHRNDLYAYDGSDISSPIKRHARENAYYFRIDANITKQINNKHSISLGANGGDWINHLTYTGTNNYYDSFHSAFMAALMNYNYRNNKFNLNTRVGVCYEPSKINSIRDRVTYPFASVNLGYSPNSKNSFSALFDYSYSSPTISHKVSDILKQNEFMYVSGNPYLKTSPMFGTQISYTLTPIRNLSLSLFGYLIDSFDRILLTYAPYNDGHSILRSFVNNGDMITSSIGVSANLTLFDNSLQMYANPSVSFLKSTGIYEKTSCPVSIVFQATYYLSKFFFQLYYKSPQETMYSVIPGIYSTPDYYSLAIGWSDSNWNIRLTAANIFNNSWRRETEKLYSDWYSSTSTTYGPEFHSQINLTATYTFGYGKKVMHGNEVGEQGSTSSAIIK